MKKLSFFALIFAGLCLSSCNNQPQDPARMQTLNVAIDETFRPIMQQELNVFNAKYPEAILDTMFLAETDALNLLLTDSVHSVVTTRPLSEAEIRSLRDNHQLQVRQQPFAYDAVALIVNRQNTDTLLSVSELRRIVTGELTDWSELQHATRKGEIEVVFDDENSSTVRFMSDSVCAGAELKGRLKTAHTNENVIEYVSQTPNAIGIVGVDWVRNPQDSSRLSFDQRVRVMSLSESAVTEPDNCFEPVQYYIATAEYPLIRKLYVITTDPLPNSMNYRFFYFLTDTEGQLIITNSSQLLPILPVNVRDVEVTE